MRLEAATIDPVAGHGDWYPGPPKDSPTDESPIAGTSTTTAAEKPKRG
jgi:hypothetical protein